MIIDSHFRGSKKDRNRRKKKEYAKENGIWKQLIDVEYEREKVEIANYLQLLMEFFCREIRNTRDMVGPCRRKRDGRDYKKRGINR